MGTDGNWDVLCNVLTDFACLEINVLGKKRALQYPLGISLCYHRFPRCSKSFFSSSTGKSVWRQRRTLRCSSVAVKETTVTSGSLTCLMSVVLQVRAWTSPLLQPSWSSSHFYFPSFLFSTRLVNQCKWNEKLQTLMVHD